MTITRVRWRERQRVSAADLRAEQLYRLEGMGRHFLAPHDWGVVRGLWLVPEKSRVSLQWQLTPGVAIDGYGRELLVREPIDVELPGDAKKGVTYRVYIYYCESPSSCPPCAPCRDDQAPRTSQYIQVVVSGTLSPITADADLSHARAAGGVTGLSAWPVLVGTITLGVTDTPKGTPVNAEVRYHRQRASVLRAPSGRVALRQGLLGPYDQYHLLLSTNPDSASPVKRLAIDRDGVVHVWKQLVLSGPDGLAVVPVSSNASLIIEAPMPAGVGRRITLVGALENVNSPHLMLHWLDNAGAHDVVHADLLEGKRAFLDRTFRFLDMYPVGLRLMNTAPNPHRIQVTRRVNRSKTERELVTRQFKATLAPSGGCLMLSTRDVPVERIDDPTCDGDPRAPGTASDPLEEGGVAYFRAATQVTPAPTARAIQAATEERPDGVPATALRISGGEYDEGDRSARIALGARDTTSPTSIAWHSALTIDGGRRVRMPLADTTLVVSHTLQLPPITTSATDPLTQDLLALAYSAGLRRAGRLAPTTITVELTTPTITVRRGATLSYGIEVKSTIAGVTIKRVLECIVGSPMPSDTVQSTDVALRAISGITFAIGTREPVTIPLFQHAAQHVVIAVEILVSVGGKDYVLSGVTVSTIAVTD
jgi:hypothetical protein